MKRLELSEYDSLDRNCWRDQIKGQYAKSSKLGYMALIQLLLFLVFFVCLKLYLLSIVPEASHETDLVKQNSQSYSIATFLIYLPDATNINKNYLHLMQLALNTCAN